MLKVQVRKIGNSFGVILPADLLEYMHIEAGDTLDVSADANRMVLTPEFEDQESFEDALEAVLDEDREILDELADK